MTKQQKGAAAAEKLRHTVTKDEDGMSVKALIARHFALSTKTLRRIKRVEGGITLDGKAATVAEKAGYAQTLECLVGDSRPSAIEPSDAPIRIIFEDEWLCVIDKPGGLPTHPSSLAPGRASAAGAYAAAHPGCVFHPVTRLDSGTSGVLLAAKSGHVHSLFAREKFKSGLKKQYAAICDGLIEQDRGVIDAPIARVEGSVIKRKVAPDGKSAVTLYEVTERFETKTLARFQLVTGRTHQIRVHAAYIGHPVTGDFLYGTEDRELISRPALHAQRLELVHPITSEQMSFEAPLPEDMENLLKHITSGA